MEPNTTSPGLRRWCSAAAALLLGAFCAVELAVPRRAHLTDDVAGWREADTQTIARNFAFVAFEPLFPRIAWGGDGPGYVESELQLYPALIALAMRATGESEWPGRLLSLAFIATAAWVTFRALAARFGPIPGVIALAAFLVVRAVVGLGVAIQPDPLAFLAFTLGFFAFLRFVERERRRDLLAAVALTTLAGLVKPTTLQLGLVEGLLVLLVKPSLLRRAELWVGWAATVALVAAFMLHARRLHLSYGNTFGTISGGDSKFPHLRQLLTPRLYLALAQRMVSWGTGWPAVVAALYLAARRRLAAEEAALAFGALAMGLAAFRYTAGRFGPYYHVTSALLGAWLVAHAVAAWMERAPRARGWRAVAPPAAFVLLFAHQARGAAELLAPRAPEPETVLGLDLSRLVRPGDLVAVRARGAPARDEQWDTDNNYQDPRVFYLARARGWALASDQLGAAPVAAAAARGARYYVQPCDALPNPGLDAWLARHARTVVARPEGRIEALGPAAAAAVPLVVTVPPAALDTRCPAPPGR